jgi:hypothetical protein
MESSYLRKFFLALTLRFNDAGTLTLVLCLCISGECRASEARIMDALMDVDKKRNVCETCVSVISRTMTIARYPCGSPAGCR